MSTFFSKYRELRLIVKASRPINKNGNIEIIPGKHIDFVNGRYSTDDPSEVAFIENHPEFNHSIYKVKEPVSEKIEAIKSESKKVGRKNRKSNK